MSAVITSSDLGASGWKYCCDPLNRHSKLVSRGLQNVTNEMIARHPSLSLQLGQKICPDCRKQLCKLYKDSQPTSSTKTMDEEMATASRSVSASPESSPLSGSGKGKRTDNDCTLMVMNEALNIIGETPLLQGKARKSKIYVQTKLRTVGRAVKRSLNYDTEEEDEGVPLLQCSDESEMIQQLKETFARTTLRSEKVKILTVLPSSWSLSRIEREFSVSRYMARQAKKLLEEKGALSSPNPKAGHTLSKETLEKVEQFFYSDDVSRQMPGKKDFVSVYTSQGVREHIQKRLVLCNLKEAYQQFKALHPDVKVGFSTFAQFRPKQCVLAGSSGTHSVCVCVIHQNVKLMFIGCNLKAISQGEMMHYRSCLEAMRCTPSRDECYFGQCSECPGTDVLREKIVSFIDASLVDTIEFKQWTMTDRANLETRVLPAEDFIQIFMESLKKLQVHDFVAKKQSKFVTATKENLQQGEFLVIADFSENYSAVIQDEIQSYHWCSTQTTIHPFMCYYKGDDGHVGHTCFVVVSECTDHDTAAVHLFQRKLVDFLTARWKIRPQKIMYFSDGCAAQYKNCKNFINLCHHVDDFKVEAEWHFFATSHGKTAGDGAAGTLKRSATRSSLQRPYAEQIITPRQLYDYACNTIKGMNFDFATLQEHRDEERLLNSRFAAAKTIPGTQKLHFFQPLTKDTLEVKQFSNSLTSRHVRVTRKQDVESLPAMSIYGYIVVEYDGLAWLGCTMAVDVVAGSVTVKFLHPHLPAPLFKFTEPPDILDVDLSDIICKATPTTVTGRTYSLTKKEMSEASSMLAKRY